MVAPSGMVAPRVRPIVEFTTPATSPLIAAICTGSPADTFRVKLLSMPQARQAPAMANVPQAGSPVGLPAHDSTTPPAVMQAMPTAMRRSKFSRKTNQASSAVNTPSRFNSSEASAAGVVASPTIRSIGPNTPPKAIEPANHGASTRFNGASVASIPRTRQRTISHADNPTPEPRYSSPANRMGPTPVSNNLANGVLAPKRIAAARA